MRFGFDAIMDSFSGEWESELKGDIVPQILAGEVDLIIFTTCKCLFPRRRRRRRLP
jgi:hypothetical protein